MDTTGPVVLVLRALGLGDGLTGIAALRGLRRAFGVDARLVLAAPAGIGGWLVDRGVVDEVLVTADLDDVVDSWRAVHRHPPAVAVDLHGRGPRSHRLLQALDPDRLIAWRCAAAGYDQGPVHDDTEHEVARWCRLVTATTGAPCGPADLVLDRPTARIPLRRGYVLVHPGAAAGSRCWPATRFAEAVQALVAAGRQVVLTGSAAERPLVAAVAAATPGVVPLAGELDLDGLADVTANAATVLCGDTGVAHLATAYRVRSVLLFGPTPPQEWGPCLDLDRHRVLWHGPDVVRDATVDPNARYRGDPHGSSIDPALELIGVREVLDALGLP